MSDSRPEDDVLIETDRIEVVRGLNQYGDTITVVRAPKPGGGTPPRFVLHGLLGVAGYRINRDDWEQA